MGNGGFIGRVSLLEPPEEVEHRLKRPALGLGFVSDLLVHPLKRRTGWGNTLMDCITKHADRSKIDLWLYACPIKDEFPSMTRGGLIAYYSRWGFEAVEKPEYEYEMVRRCRR